MSEIGVYLDDERETPSGWVRTCTVEETINWLKTGKVKYLSLDNDLGEGQEEGYKVMDWIEEQVFTNPEFVLPKITIHSANPTRVQYMNSVIRRCEERSASNTF